MVVWVQVKSIAVNPVDAFVRGTKEALNWVYTYECTEEHIILDWDVAGIVVNKGRAVTRLKKEMRFLGTLNSLVRPMPTPNMWQH